MSQTIKSHEQPVEDYLERRKRHKKKRQIRIMSAEQYESLPDEPAESEEQNA